MKNGVYIIYDYYCTKLSIVSKEKLRQVSLINGTVIAICNQQINNFLNFWHNPKI